VIVVNDVDPQIFSIFLGFLYSGRCQLNTSNIEPLSDLAIKWEKQDLCNVILKKIMKSVKTSDLITAQTFLSKKYGDSGLGDEVDSWLVKWRNDIVDHGIDDYIQSGEFLKCPVELVCVLLQSDDITLNEADVFERVLCWGRYQVKDGSLSMILQKPVACIRFGLMDPDYLLSHVGGGDVRDLVPTELYLNTLESHILRADTRVKVNSIGPAHLYKPRKMYTSPQQPKKSLLSSVFSWNTWWNTSWIDSFFLGGVMVYYFFLEFRGIFSWRPSWPTFRFWSRK
jgi:hypothetical protein